MPRGCSICESRARAAVDADLIAGRSVRDVAASHSLGYQAVNRHRLNHLPAAIRRAAREALAREDAASAAQPIDEETVAPVAAARPTPATATPQASPIASSTGRTRRRGMELDPAAPTDPDATVAPGMLSTSVGAPPSATAGTLDLHEAALGLQRRAMTILETAERDGDAKVALIAIREARGVLEHLSRLQERTGANAQAVPLAQSPEWVRTRNAIVAALADFPDARIAVAEALVATGSAS